MERKLHVAIAINELDHPTIKMEGRVLQKFTTRQAQHSGFQFKQNNHLIRKQQTVTRTKLFTRKNKIKRRSPNITQQTT